MKKINIEAVIDAYAFACDAHAGQRRRYNNEPYVNHPKRVAAIVQQYGGTEKMVISSLLHDTVEDTYVELADIEKRFGRTVREHVNGLTKASLYMIGVPRRQRKMADNAFLAGRKPFIQTIKLADILDNTVGIVDDDPSWAKVYLSEKLELLAVMNKGEARLHQRVYTLLTTELARC